MSKLKGLLKAIKATSDAIAVLESNGVNVDKIVGVSNAQGPHARVLQGAITELADALKPLVGSDSIQEDVKNVIPQKSLKPRASSKKKTVPGHRG
jgi:hypothetical protein